MAICRQVRSLLLLCLARVSLNNRSIVFGACRTRMRIRFFFPHAARASAAAAASTCRQKPPLRVADILSDRPPTVDSPDNDAR